MKLKMPGGDDKSFIKKGSLVEVRSDSDGYKGVWYVAKVLEPPSPPRLTPSPPNKRTKNVHIEYQTLLRDVGSGKALTEYVNSSFVRPLPPNDEHDLQVNDFVDAMSLDGWWIGVVVEINQEQTFSVYFENPPQLLHFKRHELRPHWDWEGGKWIRPQKQVAKISSRVLRRRKVFKFLKFVFVGFHYEEQSPCSGTANPEETDIVANCKKLKSIAKKKGRPGCLKRKRGERQKTSAIGTQTLAVDVLVLKDYDSTDAESPISTGKSKRTKHDGVGEDVDKLLLKYHEIDDGLSTENMEESKVRKHDGAGSSVKKFAFKDHAIDAESAKNTGDFEGTKNDGAEGDADNMVLKYPVIIDAESPTNAAESKDEKRYEARVAVNKMNLEDYASNGVESSEITGESTGSKDASAEKAANISDTGCSTREAEMAIVQLPGDVDTAAKPTSMWFDGLCSRKILIDSRFLCGRTINQNQRNKAKGKLTQIVKESTANDSAGDRVREKNQCFPGMELSSMRKTFSESVEVLETMPQKPHFHPLKQCKEMFRDGLAFGYMITFAKVVKRTSDLQVNDPKSIFDSISETLQDIELHGFDVQPIRNRLTELQLMKDRQEQLQEVSKEFEHQILDHTHEQMKINAEFAEVVEGMKLLEEKKRKIMLLMQQNDSKITELKSDLDVCKQDIQNAQLDFESLAAAPW
ncbi:LOW QUALITY PROTEIN: DUF724 domain-containing protein 3-like [Pistacia vera]|uniref:LOW QUALITY PROTEIN: DUF724 domain-containing protein 3-like n=1 Tax=Pistacia vera TaxID=55513 RepID=UPI001263E6F3|nr:LOW QUALITY PROTEIN: DUF724 domain-containing protein 3-like [Pistacia vera]